MAQPAIKISASCLVTSTLRGSATNRKRAVATVNSVSTVSGSADRSRRLSSASAAVSRVTASSSRTRSASASVRSSASAVSRVLARYSSSAVLAASSYFSSSLTSGDVLIQTDQNGQNTHVCIGDSVNFNFTVVKDYVVRKAIFSMKRSKNSTSGCSVSIYDQAYGQGNMLATSFIPVASFSQQWTDMLFVFDLPITPNNTYSLVVSSTTSCNDNNDSFFIKAGAIEVVDMANGVVISNGYSIQTKKPRCEATLTANATRIRNALSSGFSVATQNAEAMRTRFAKADCYNSSSFDSYGLRKQEAVSQVESKCEFNTAGQLLASVYGNIQTDCQFMSELTGGIVADSLILNYNLVQPESFSGEGSDTVYDIVSNSDMRLFPKPSIAGVESPDGIGHWDMNQGVHRRIYPNFSFYYRNRYGRKNGSNRIVQVGPYYSDFAFGTIKFNGVDSYGVTVNDLSGKFSNNKMSAFMWAYPTREGVLLSEQGSFTPNENWRASQMEIVEGVLKFGVWTDDGLVQVASSIPIEYFHWYYLGFTYDGSTLRGYVSGQPAGSVDAVRSTPYSNGYGTYYCVGHGTDTNMGDGRFGSMRFGQMHLYGDSLTDEEVYFNWYNTRARFEDPDHYANMSGPGFMSPKLVVRKTRPVSSSSLASLLSWIPGLPSSDSSRSR